MTYLGELKYFLTGQGKRFPGLEPEYFGLDSLDLEIVVSLREGPKTRGSIVRSLRDFGWPAWTVENALGELVHDGYINFEVEDEQ